MISRFLENLFSRPAQVQEEKFAVMLYDSGLDGGGRIRCVRGLDCVMDMSNSSALMYQYGFVQPSVEGANCLPCYEAYGYDTPICWDCVFLCFFSVFSMFFPIGERLIFGLYWEHKGHFSWPFMTPWAPWSSQNRSKGGSSANLSSDMISSFNLTGSSTNLLANLGMSLKDRESLRRFANMSWTQKKHWVSAVKNDVA